VTKRDMSNKTIYRSQFDYNEKRRIFFTHHT